MMIEVVRLVDTALQDVTKGVNAQLATLTLDGSDVVPPNVLTFRNVADNDLGVREGDFATPFLVVDVRQDATVQGYATSGVRDGTVQVIVGYVTKGGTAAKNFRDTDYSLRAIAKALHSQLWAGTGSDAARKRNGIVIKNSPTMTLQAVKQEVWGGMMTGVVAITFNVRDQSP